MKCTVSATAVLLDTSESVLWACPCGEFKWTSYAEWENRIASKITMDNSPVGTAGQLMAANDWERLRQSRHRP